MSVNDRSCYSTIDFFDDTTNVAIDVTTGAMHCYFLLIKCENPLHCKDSHILSTKINILFVIFMFENLTNR